jgi:N-acetylmuramic acid 6-phosphate etherase
LGAAWLAERTAGDRRWPVEEGAKEIVADAAGLAKAATEQANPRSVNLEERTTAELVDLFATEEEQVARALVSCRSELIAAVDLVSDALRAGGRLFHLGAGTSGRLGVLDASEIPPTFGAPPELVQGIIAGGAEALHRAVEGAEDQPAAGAQAIVERGVRAGDVLCGIAASGRTPFVLGALERARQLGARTILLTCNPLRAKATTSWDAEIDLPVGPEIITGSTRLKAGTATKVTLNLLSTCAMIRLGRVRGNAMVDLHISNAKLRDRGVRLVSTTLGLGYDEARERLERTGWNVRACLEGE